MAFAVISTGGKQYMVKEGDKIVIEKLTGEFKVGDKVTFDQVILKDDGKSTELGAPFIKSEVTGKIEEIGKKDKIMVVRYKAKSRYHKRNGHRQPFMKVLVEKI